MDGLWADGPDETSTTVSDMIQPWLPMSSWNEPVPPCARCGAAFAAHLEGRCPRAEYRAPRRDWPTRHPWYTAAILLVALLGGIGVGTVSVSHTSYTSYTIHSTGNAQACYAYWPLRDSAYSFEQPASTAEWYKLQAAAPGVTDPMLSNAIQAFDENLLASDLVDAVNYAADIEAVCNSLGYPDPA